MTDDRFEQVNPDALRLLHRRARAVVQGFSESLPAYDQVPRPMVEADFVRGTQLNVDLFIRALTTGASPTDAELEPVVELARTRYDDGVPLEEVIGNYHRVVDAVWSALHSDSELAQQIDLNRYAVDMVHYVTRVVTRIALACQENPRSSESWNRAEVDQQIVEALLNGQDPPTWAAAYGPQLTQVYSVAVLRLDDDADVAYSRAFGKRLARAGAIISAQQSGWIVLLGHSGPTIPSLESVAAELSTMQQVSTTDVDIRVLGGVARAEQRSGIPGAYHAARTVCQLRAIATEPIAAVVAPGDVLFGFLVATGAADDYLSQVRNRLCGDPALDDTLRAYLSCAGNQLATARMLHVHRNTVSHRLARIHELTGHDPATPVGAAVHQAAALAAQLHAASATGDGRRGTQAP